MSAKECHNSLVFFYIVDIQIECGKGVVLVRLRVGPELSLNVSRILLGSCYATEFVPLPEGGGDLFFHYALTACHFKKMVSQFTRVMLFLELFHLP